MRIRLDRGSWIPLMEELLADSRSESLDQSENQIFGEDQETGSSWTLTVPPGWRLRELPRLRPGPWLQEDLVQAFDPSLVLLDAPGAWAVAVWSPGGYLATKVQKRYVIRGHGKAQGKHLKTRGKSRYGSRLRLQNAQRLELEIRQKLEELEQAFGPFERVFASLGGAAASLTVRDLEFLGRGVKIPIDLPRPSRETLERVRFWLEGAVVDIEGEIPEALDGA